MKMSRRWIILGLALLCVVQVWTMPADSSNDEDDDPNDPNYQGDSGNDDGGSDDDNDNDSASLGTAKMLTQPQDFRTKIGSEVIMPCHVEITNPESFSTMWLRINDKSSGQEYLYLESLKQTSEERFDRLDDNSLVIRGITANDASFSYVCAVTDSEKFENQTKVTHHLYIDYSENNNLIRVTPRNLVELKKGEEVTIGCELSDNSIQPIEMFWSHKGERSEPSLKEGNRMFKIVRDAGRAEAGDYQCVFLVSKESNPLVQHIRIRVKHLEIEHANEHIHKYVVLDRTVNLNCTAHAHPPIREFSWTKDNKKVEMNSREFKSQIENGHHEHLLTIVNAGTDDLGVYQCAAKSDEFAAVGPIIYLHELPGQPIFKYGGVDEDAIVFRWSVPSYKPIIDQQVYLRKHGEKNWTTVSDVKLVSTIGKEKVIEAKITGIEPGKHEAKLRVRSDEESTNEKHWGPWSPIHDFDGEYKASESVGGSSAKATTSLMALLFITLPLTYSCL